MSFLRRRGAHHKTPVPPAHPPRGAPDYGTGSMVWKEEAMWLGRPDGVIHVDRGGRSGRITVMPWEPPHGAEAGAISPKLGLWNGHTFGCLAPDEDHPGACPEEGDDPDDPYCWPPSSGTCWDSSAPRQNRDDHA